MAELHLFVRAVCGSMAVRDELVRNLKPESSMAGPLFEAFPDAEQVEARGAVGLVARFSSIENELEAGRLLDVVAQHGANAVDACFSDEDEELVVWRRVGDSFCLVYRAGNNPELDPTVIGAPCEEVLDRLAGLAPGIPGWRIGQPADPVEAFLEEVNGRKKKLIRYEAFERDRYWHPEDPAWVAKRELEWQHVLESRRVLVHPPFMRKYDKLHRALFLSGRVEGDFKTLWEAFEGGEWLFEMGYHPEPNVEVFWAILERKRQESRSDWLGLEELFEYGGSWKLRNDYGLFGGREEVMVKAMLPIWAFEPNGRFPDGRSWPYRYSLNTGDFVRSKLAGKCIEHMGNLLNFPDLSPFMPGHYVWDHLSLFLEQGELNERQLKSLRNSILPRVMIFDCLNDELVRRSMQGPYREANKRLLLSLRNRFEDSGFHPKLMALWHEAEARYANKEFDEVKQVAWQECKSRGKA